MRRVMVWLGFLMAVYAAIVLLLWLGQERLLFPGAWWGDGRPLPSVPGVRTTTMELPGGSRFRVAIGRPGDEIRGVLLFFVGNGENLSSAVRWAGELASYRVMTVVPEYPGYGESEGEPSFASCMAAADVAGRFARAEAERRDVPLLAAGSSLGTFLATHVAATRGAARLLLLAPPTSVADVGSRRFPWLPVRWLIRHPFDNVGRAEEVRCPVLVVHGDRDDIVPLEFGRRVAEALDGELLVAKGHGHSGEPLQPDGPFGRRIAEFLDAGR